MSTAIKYFGMIAEKVGTAEETIDFGVRTESIDLRNFFEVRYPALVGMTYQIAINQEFVAALEANLEVHEIALLPPFAGG
ncbi:MAG: molybdopterin converting factor small subunit [Flavobacteriaceae bacterium]|jgi:molybdopterin converting factor small subunit